MKTERALQDYLRHRAKSLGMTFDKLESRSRQGFPDALIVYKGVVMFVELKTPAGTGKVSPAQQRVMTDLHEHGANVRLVDSKELADQVLQEIEVLHEMTTEFSHADFR